MHQKFDDDDDDDRFSYGGGCEEGLIKINV